MNPLLTLFVLLMLPFITMALEIAHPEELPTVIWQTYQTPEVVDEPIHSSNLHLPLPSFPQNLRRFGPPPLNSAATLLESLHLPLLAWDASGKHWAPMLASQWSIDTSRNLVFIAIHPQARWSDNTPVTTADIEFSLRFLTTEKNQTGWQSERIKARIRQLDIYDSHHFALHLHSPFQESLTEIMAFRPLAAHFYAARNWPDDMNWEAEPVTGAYRLAGIQNNEQMIFRRIPDWWGESLPLFRNRFHPKRITFRFMGSGTQAWTAFTRGELDVLPLTADDLNRAVVTGFRQSHQVALLQKERSDMVTESIVLLNPDHPHLKNRSDRLRLLSRQNYMSDTGALPELSLTSPDTVPQWLKDFPHRVIPQSELLPRILNGDFAMAWITFSDTLNNDQLQALLSPLFSQYGKLSDWTDQGIIKTYHPVSRYALYWQWLKTSGQWSAATYNPLDPFNSLAGGTAWIDRAQRTDIMQNPLKTGGLPPAEYRIDRDGHSSWFHHTATTTKD